MTDQQKVNKMFEIRKQELPKHNPESVKRVSEQLSPAFSAFWALLEMYNKRYCNDKRIAEAQEQGRMF